MPFQAKVLRVLIASPGDTVNERRILRDVIEEWNGLHGDQGIFLQPLMWERDATPELGDSPQGVINRQLVDNADMLIGIFWTRLGTPTSEADSGTVEEIERVAAAGKPVLLYFSKRPVVLDSVDHAEYARVKDAERHFMGRGLVDTFDSEDGLARKVSAAITRTVRTKFGSAEELRSDDIVAPYLRPPGARLVAMVDRFTSKERFVVENRGDAAAEDLRISIEADDGGRKPAIFIPDAPVRSVPPGAAVDFPMAITMGTSLVWDVVLRWTDPRGDREVRQTLTY